MPAPARTITTRQLNRALLARQMLLAREKTTVLKAIERLVALQAQVPKPPFVGLWTRVEGFERNDLLSALSKRKVIRATAMRATIHVMTAADFIALRGALQPGLDKGLQTFLRDRAKAADLEALVADGREYFRKEPRTFDAFRDYLTEKYPQTDVRAMAYTVRLRVPLVQVPTDTTWGFPASADFALADEWLGKSVPTTSSSAELLVKRYLAAFGPATPADAQCWSGLGGLREVFESLRPSLVTFRDERKRELFDLPDAPRPDADEVVPVRFLPDFDNLVLSHDDRTRIMADAYRPLVTTKNLQVRATFLIDGFVAGAWKTERKKKTATLVLEPFGKITKPVIAALEREGDALLRFVEEDAEVREVRVAK
jgi:hypothetical protein